MSGWNTFRCRTSPSAQDRGSLVLLGLALLVLLLAGCGGRSSSRFPLSSEAVSDTARYPSGFLWGTATSAHQVEGGCADDNWSQFERSRDPSGAPRVYQGEQAGAAADHWNRWPEDIALMESLGVNAYRFSVEWSKVEPEEGVFDQAALDHYAAVVRGLREAGIEPLVTIHHFTNPLWFENKGGFLAETSPAIFARYAGRVGRELMGGVRYWITINEPSVFAVNGYYIGEFPPGHHDADEAVTVLLNMMRAHGLAYTALKHLDSSLQVGLATNIFIYEPGNRWNPLDVLAAYYANLNLNRAIIVALTSGELDLTFPGFSAGVCRIEGGTDFIGLNYYTRFFLRLRPWESPPLSYRSPDVAGQGLTDMGWEIYPEGLYRSLRMISTITSKPILITENGLATTDGTVRERFIRDHLRMVDRAIAAGMNVRGFFYWSLLDNFEWAKGFSKKFGLYHVDFKTQKRELKPGSESFRRGILRRSGGQGQASSP